METEKNVQMSPESRDSVSPVLTPLDKTQDNFESLLLLLLQAYTTQNLPGSLSILGGAPISGEALDTLSPEQITALITSNSVNYEVIQQILAQQKNRAGRDCVRLPSPNRSLTLNLSSEEIGEESNSKGSTPLCSPALTPVADGNQQLQQLIQITPQQLQLLQSQVNELLQSQHIALPADLSPDQQQQLIQTLLLRQLHIQQSSGAKDASSSMNQLLSVGQGTESKGAGESDERKNMEATTSESRSSNGSGERGRTATVKEVEGGAAKGTQSKKVGQC